MLYVYICCFLQSPASESGKIYEGAEIIQINDRNVVSNNVYNLRSQNVWFARGDILWQMPKNSIVNVAIKYMYTTASIQHQKKHGKKQSIVKEFKNLYLTISYLRIWREGGRDEGSGLLKKAYSNQYCCTTVHLSIFLLSGWMGSEECSQGTQSVWSHSVTHTESQQHKDGRSQEEAPIRQWLARQQWWPVQYSSQLTSWAPSSTSLLSRAYQ